METIKIISYSEWREMTQYEDNLVMTKYCQVLEMI